MKTILTFGALALLLSLGAAWAQNTQTSASTDNPLSGLNLTDSSNPKEMTGLAGEFAHHLVVLDGNRAKTFDASPLAAVKYFAFYYSASWCPPCRAFTPKLVEFYNDFKAKHPNFELIFVNHDQDADDMLAYMKTDSMPWPAVRFDDIDQTNANRFCGSGIPDLVLVDDKGKVLSDSFNGSNYVGPYQVLDDIKKLVP